MTRAAFPLVTLCVALVLIGAVLTGCRSEAPADAGGAAAVAPEPPPTPEEEFNRIATVFRNAIDTDASGVPTGIQFNDATGHTSISVRKNVTDVKFIPPTKEGEPCRGTITVVWHSSYSMRAATPEADEQQSSGNKDEANPQGLPVAAAGDDGVDVLDPDLIAAATKSSDPGPVQEDEVFARRTNDEERTFELEYVGDRWVLKTKLDPHTEQSIQFAFEHALASQ